MNLSLFKKLSSSQRKSGSNIARRRDQESYARYRSRWIPTFVGMTAFSTAIILSSPAHADTPSILVTPNRTATAADSVAAAVTVVDRDAMEQQGFVSLEDALQDVPGLSLSRSGSFGGVSSVFLRGTESGHTLVLQDGMPINDVSNTTGLYNFSEDLLGSAERVEIVRGPASVLYGSNAIGGVVNLISREPTDTLHTAATLYGGSYGTGGGEGLVSGKEGKLGFVFDAEGQHSDGFNTLPKRFPINYGATQGSDTYALFGKLTYAIDNNTRLSGQARYRDLTFGLNDVPYNAPNYVGRSAAINWQTRAEHDWLGKAVTSSVTIGQTRTDRRYDNNPDAVSFAAGSNIQHAHYNGVLTAVTQQNDIHLPDAPRLALDQIKLVTGVTYAHESTNIAYRSDGTFGPFNQTADASTAQTGLFGQAEGRVFKRIDLTAGLRHDLPQDFAAHTSTNLGGVLQVPEVGGRVTSSFGTSFRTPSLFERFGVDNFGLVGNPNLKPETATSWDAGIEKDFAAHTTVGARYFETSTRNLIQYVFGAPPQYVNIARSEINGTESWVTTKPLPWLEGGVNWTWLRSINASGQSFASTPDGKPLLRRPTNTVAGHVTLSPLPSWSVTPKIRYVSSQYDVLYDDAGNFTGRGRVGGYVLADLATTYAITDHVSVYSHIHNLLNRRVESPNGYLQEPLTVMVGVKVE